MPMETQMVRFPTPIGTIDTVIERVFSQHIVSNISNISIMASNWPANGERYGFLPSSGPQCRINIKLSVKPRQPEHRHPHYLIRCDNFIKVLGFVHTKPQFRLYILYICINIFVCFSSLPQLNSLGNRNNEMKTPNEKSTETERICCRLNTLKLLNTRQIMPFRVNPFHQWDKTLLLFIFF